MQGADPGPDNGMCMVYKKPDKDRSFFSVAKFDFGLELWSTHLRAKDHPTTIALHRLCFENAVREANARSGSDNGVMDWNYFDTVLVNNFLFEDIYQPEGTASATGTSSSGAKPLLKIMQDHSFRGQLVMHPQFAFGTFGTNGPNPMVIGAASKPVSSSRGGKSPAFVKGAQSLLSPLLPAVNPAAGQLLMTQPSVSTFPPSHVLGGVFKMDSTEWAVATGNRHGFQVHYIGLENLYKSRKGDAKACMYPLVYLTDIGSPQNLTGIPSWSVCQKNRLDLTNKCEKHPLWHMYNSEARTSGIKAEKESHFCLPGPLDTAVRLLFTAALSPSDY